ncbi:MAG: glycerate kinase, partial [Alcaligenaceae bacterium]|nr:glycerate kinase [Alcaligenaceae bacterium]
MRVVVAPDSYKESLSAAEVAAAMAHGVRQAAPQAEILCVPMADGGEGSLAAVLAATSGQRRQARVQDANGSPCEAAWGWLGDATAFIEMAEAAGLERIALAQRQPLQASTYGVGQLVLEALNAGARRIVLGLGGSATTDGGAGLLQALGAQLLDAHGAELPPGGAALKQLAHIDLSRLDARLADIQFEIAVDVDNPLCGERGAAAIFGPQKGATAHDVQLLDQALAHFAAVCHEKTGKDPSRLPGTGSAGGLGFAIKSFFQAEFRPGVELIAKLARLDDALRGADLVFTGEGRMDRQTLLGKTPAGVARYGRSHGVPVIALAGSLGEGYEALYEVGVTAAFSVVSGPMKLEQACGNAAQLVR